LNVASGEKSKPPSTTNSAPVLNGHFVVPFVRGYCLGTLCIWTLKETKSSSVTVSANVGLPTVFFFPPAVSTSRLGRQDCSVLGRLTPACASWTFAVSSEFHIPPPAFSLKKPQPLLCYLHKKSPALRDRQSFIFMFRTSAATDHIKMVSLADEFGISELVTAYTCLFIL